MPAFTLDDVQRAFPNGSFERGRNYQRAGRARVIRVAEEGASLEGEVQGGNPRPYQVSVGIRRLGTGRLVIGGQCSCPLEFDCKHVIALLLEFLSSSRTAAPAPPAPGPIAVQPVPPRLSPEVVTWLAGLERGEGGADEPYPPDIRQRLLYVLDVAADWGDVPRPRVQAVSVRQLVDGGYSDKISWVEPAIVLALPAPPKYLRASDLAILRGLSRMLRSRHDNARTLVGDEGAAMLNAVLATGRCHWQTIASPSLALGESCAGTIRWSLRADGRQQPQVQVQGDRLTLPMTPPWYVDVAARLCGPVDTGLSPRLTAQLLAAPPIAAAEVAAVRARLAAALPNSGSPEVTAILPPEPMPPRQVDVRPVPRLRLFGRRLPAMASWAHGRGAVAPLNAPLARLSFLYDGLDVEGSESGDTVTLVNGDSVITVVRRPQVEREARRQLDSLGFRLAAGRLSRWQVPADQRGSLTLSSGSEADLDEEVWLDFMIEEVPSLREEGWRVDVDDDFPFRVALPEGEPEAELAEGSGIDWFDLHLGVPVEGQRIDILPALLKVLRQLPADGLDDFLNDDSDDAFILRLRLDDGRILPLPFARLRPILNALAGLYTNDSGDGAVRFAPADAAALATLADSTEAHGLVWRGGEKLRALGRRLQDADGIPPVTVPDLFVGTLRPYQQTGVAWMQLLRDIGLGGVLADDMGLGKTVQTLAHLAIEKASARADRPSLIVAPTSVLPNWLAETASFTPGLSVMVLHGPARKEMFAEIAHHDIVLTTYPLLARDIDALEGYAWHVVIVDEAQVVKNPATAAAQALRRLDARHRLALTGTPLENHLGELWALFDFVSPGFLGDARGFAKAWRAPIEKKADGARQAALARRVRPFLLRRTKAVVAADLPPKTEIVEHIELSQAQRDLYEGIRLAMHKKVREAIAAKGLKRSRIELLDALLKLRQACCDPRLVKTGSSLPKGASAKLTRLMEMLPELIGEGRRILLFSQFTSMLALIEAELRTSAIPYLLLTGDTVDRTTPVKRFQAGREPLFLISLKAGGTGINLTAADTVIHYDPWWNPAVEAQATDRAHRLGQDKPVFVHKLVAQDTIEVKMADLKARKQALADGLFVTAEGSPIDIGADDIEFLLGA